MTMKGGLPMGLSALVTGGSGGIGLAITRMLVREGYGVTICGRDTGRLDRAAATLDGEIHPVAADVSHEEDVRGLVRAHAQRFGGLDVLVNSAGVLGSGSDDPTATAAIDRQIAVNLRGPLLVTREALPLLRAAGAEHGKALIVNLASVAGKQGQPGNPVYSATKAGLISLTESSQRATAADGIQATALCPGLVATGMTEGSSVARDAMIQPEDVAEAVRFVLRTSASCVVPEIVLNRRGAVT
jgi:NAD(P)-dependent dehydrogenase (short-subunit alcohol dehydrogenase family)